MTEKRRCKVNEQPGDFIQYGNEPYSDDSNHVIGLRTIAIVELDSGRVVHVAPEHVTFPPKRNAE